MVTQLTDDYFQLARTQKAEYNQYLSQSEPVTVKLDGKVYHVDPRREPEEAVALTVASDLPGSRTAAFGPGNTCPCRSRLHLISARLASCTWI